MLTEKEIIKKIFDLPDMFEIYYTNKQYLKAKRCYDTAIVISVFVELSEADKILLFGNRPYAEEKEQIEDGLFPEEKVSKVCFECIKKNETYDQQDFRECQLMNVV